MNAKTLVFRCAVAFAATAGFAGAVAAEAADEAVPGMAAGELLNSGLAEFRELARSSPQFAVESFGERSVRRKFKELSEVLGGAKTAETNWAWFFASAVYSPLFADAETAIAMFYNPWCDAALLTRWTWSDKKGNRLLDTDLVTGDYIRSAGSGSSESVPFWRRNPMPPYGSVPLQTVRTVGAFQKYYAEGGALRAPNWKKGLMAGRPEPFVRRQQGIAATMLDKVVKEIVVVATADDFAALRPHVSTLFEQLAAGDAEAIFKTVPETAEASRQALRTGAPNFVRARLVATSRKRHEDGSHHRFLLFSSPATPELILCAWYQEAGGESADGNAGFRPRRIDIIDLNQACINADQVEKIAGGSATQETRP